MKLDPLQPFIGTYRLGLYNVDVYGLTNDAGGCFYNTPDDKNNARMKIGFNNDWWSEVVSVLCHEAFEFVAVQRGVRLVPSHHHRPASDVYQFHFDHNQFSSMMDDVAFFLTKVLPDLSAAYKKHRKNKK